MDLCNSQSMQFNRHILHTDHRKQADAVINQYEHVAFRHVCRSIKMNTSHLCKYTLRVKEIVHFFIHWHAYLTTHTHKYILHTYTCSQTRLEGGGGVSCAHTHLHIMQHIQNPRWWGWEEGVLIMCTCTSMHTCIHSQACVCVWRGRVWGWRWGEQDRGRVWSVFSLWRRGCSFYIRGDCCFVDWRHQCLWNSLFSFLNLKN